MCARTGATSNRLPSPLSAIPQICPRRNECRRAGCAARAPHSVFSCSGGGDGAAAQRSAAAVGAAEGARRGEGEGARRGEGEGTRRGEVEGAAAAATAAAFAHARRGGEAAAPSEHALQLSVREMLVLEAALSGGAAVRRA
jgi:hypothetical protein